MQTLAFLWFELQAARRRLRETFAEEQAPVADAESRSSRMLHHPNTPLLPNSILPPSRPRKRGVLHHSISQLFKEEN
jgi:hypothetical protein